MSGLTVVHEVDSHVSVRDGDVELFRYTYRPDTPLIESPKPYIHPIRTRAGRLVSLFRPHDHVWHKGLAWSLPVVGEENFWGGPTYVQGKSYVQLPNNGTQQHVGAVDIGRDDGVVRISHALVWRTQAGENRAGAEIFTERRTLSARINDEASWILTFETALTSTADQPITIGSPTTRGRPNAGYGGLFWRGPRSFTDGALVTADRVGTGDEVRGTRHEWMGFVGRHDGIDASSIVLMVDDEHNPHHPPQWFARSQEFAALNPAPFFSEELVIEPGQTVHFRYAVAVADGDHTGAARLAAAARAVLAEDAVLAGDAVPGGGGA